MLEATADRQDHPIFIPLDRTSPVPVNCLRPQQNSRSGRNTAWGRSRSSSHMFSLPYPPLFCWINVFLREGEENWSDNRLEMTLECPLEKLPLRVPHPATGQGWLPGAAVLPLQPRSALCIQTPFPGKGRCQNGAFGHYSLLCVSPILQCCFTGKLLMVFSSPHEHAFSSPPQYL